MDDGLESRSPRGPLSRVRQVAMILIFDLGGPLAAYSLLRAAAGDPGSPATVAADAER